jgi:hypothetical protein
MSKGKIDIQEIAERIDDLILVPAKMQKWRDQVKRGLKRFKSGKDLKEALIGCDPTKDIIPFYTVLACCHDDFLKVNYIFTDTLKTINPQLCNYPDICLYDTQGVPRMLSRYLIYVERDLSGVDKDENIVNKRNENQQGKNDYSREKQAKEENDEKPKDLMSLYEVVEKYKTSRSTLQKMIAAKPPKIQSWRNPRLGEKSKHLVSEKEIKNYFPLRKQ